MMSVRKKLSIAFYWHMHQPVYQLNSNSDYLMPWVRLHGVKDYLDMLLVAKDFEKLKLNFNLVPVLLDSLIDYGEKNYHDIHSRLTVTGVSELTKDDKEFILNNFFDANFSSMIYHNEEYNQLYQKRFASDGAKVNEFSDQEYSDIMAWFNLVWIDPIYKNMIPELESLLSKGRNYTLDDRIAIIEIHRAIIRRIIPTYREILEQGKIEITTSPYYHSILPILLDAKSAQKNLSTPDGSISDLLMSDDAKLQVNLALDRVEELFGKRPKGIWPSEHSISPQELDLFKEVGLQWTISDEGILASSLDTEFVRDFKGYLENPYALTKSYKYKTKNSDIQMIFRNSILANLISFEYPNHDPKVAAADLYDRIKVLQNKLQSSPDKNHLITIAMDGENCWENYLHDGTEFLRNIYSLIEEDESLETVLISDYLDSEKYHKQLKKVTSGSWINKNFQLWIAEPVKNLAWSYLKQVKEDFVNFKKLNPEHRRLELAHREILIAQGSDWFWWYGEPNDSGQDHIFDYLFREHLKNVYRYLEVEPPNYLNTPLISFLARPTRDPKTNITPQIGGEGFADEDEWQNAGCIDMPDGFVLQENKLFERICYGVDQDNFYLRIYLNEKERGTKQENVVLYQMYVYLRTSGKQQFQSPVRLANKSESVSPMIREKFHNELRISVAEGILYPVHLIKAIPDGLWAIESSKGIQSAFEKTIDISIPLDDLDVKNGEKLEFFFANANFGIKETFAPQDILLNVQRP